MKALTVNAFAPYAEHKVEQATPTPMKPGHVRIAVKAAGLNFPDILMVEGKYQMKPPFPFTPGSECAGVITELANDVVHLKIGDRVAAMVPAGAFATECLAPMQLTWPIGDMPFETAAGIALVYGTSYYGLKQRGELQPGETLLVLGAAGGVGLAAVELGKAMGARVIAAASTDEKLNVCRQHGADEEINYTQEDIKARVKALGGADIVYDPVGDKYAEPAMRSLNLGGRHLVIGFAAGEIPKIPLNLALLKSIDIRGVFWGPWTARAPKEHRKNMGEIIDMYKSGDIRPRISGTYALQDFAKACDELTERRAMGKVILTPGETN